MDIEEKNRITPLTIGFVIGQLIFMILMVAGFQVVLADDSVTVGMGGLQQEISGLPDSSRESIEYYIFRAVAKNSANNNIQSSGVKIRDGSLINTYYEELDLHYVNFIADLPDVGQSYQVFHEWSSDLENKYVSPDLATGVMCLSANDLIYGEFECDHSNDYLRNAVVYNMIYNLGYMNTGSDLSLQMLPESYASSPDFKVKLYYRECVTMCACVTVAESDKLAALKEFDDLVGSLGFYSSDIPHYFDNCENGVN